MGHTVLRIGNSGMGPYDYSRLPELWNQYIGAVNTFRPDHILLIFGSNDAANENLRNGLKRMKDAVRPPVWLSGPPHYGAADAQIRGAAIREVYKNVFTGNRFIDPYPWTGPDVPRAPDGLHFTAAGGNAWGMPLAEEFARRASSPLSSGRPDDGDLGRGGRTGNDDPTRPVALPSKPTGR